MEIIKHIFEWISIIGGAVTGISVIILALAKFLGKNFIDEWFTRRNKKYQAELEKELTEYKSLLDSKLEILKISYGNVFSERMVIFKEACKRIQETEKYCKELAKYKGYKCKDMLDFKKDCKSNCPQDCILNYRDEVLKMRDYIMETEDWFQLNEFFFSLDQYNELLKVYIEFLKLLNNAIVIIQDTSISENERANKCFDIFSKFDMNKYYTARDHLIESFRYTLNVPLISSNKIQSTFV